jgi:hypothetical protein
MNALNPKTISFKPLYIFAFMGLSLAACSNPDQAGSNIARSQASPSAISETQLSEEFESCIISSQLSQPSADIEESKQSCFTKAVERCYAASSSLAEGKSCEKNFVKASESIMKFGREVECDSGACTIIF